MTRVLAPGGLVCVFQNLLIHWKFHTQQSVEFTQNSANNIQWVRDGFEGGNTPKYQRKMSGFVQAARKDVVTHKYHSLQLW